MPIEVTRLETGILLQKVKGTLSMKDMQEAQQTGFALMKAAGDPQIVLITDAQQVTLPADFSIFGFKRLIENEDGYLLQSVVVVTSPALRLGLSSLSRVARAPMLLVSDMNTALVRARAILAKAAPAPP